MSSAAAPHVRWWLPSVTRSGFLLARTFLPHEPVLRGATLDLAHPLTNLSVLGHAGQTARATGADGSTTLTCDLGSVKPLARAFFDRASFTGVTVSASVDGASFATIDAYTVGLDTGRRKSYLPFGAAAPSGRYLRFGSFTGLVGGVLELGCLALCYPVTWLEDVFVADPFRTVRPERVSTVDYVGGGFEQNEERAPFLESELRLRALATAIAAGAQTSNAFRARRVLRLLSTIRVGDLFLLADATGPTARAWCLRRVEDDVVAEGYAAIDRERFLVREAA